MAIAYDATSRSTTTGTSLTYSHTVTGTNPGLIIGAANHSSTGDHITGATYNGVAATLITKLQTDGGSYFGYIFYVASPATGAHNVVISADSSIEIYSACGSYTGVHASTPVDVSGSATTTATSISKSVTTTIDNDWLVAFVGGNAGGRTISAGSGTTIRSGSVSDYAWADSNGAKTPTGSYSLAANYSANENAWIFVAAIRPFVASTTKPANSMLLGMG